jgi:polyferredoxin
VILGRFFCGWVCPLGTIHHLMGRLNRRRPVLLRSDAQEGAFRKYKWKYALLLFLLAASLFGVQLAGIFDPLCLLIRSLSLAVYPAVVYGLRALFDGFYALDLPFVTAGSEFVYGLFKKTLLPFSQPYASQAVALGLLFVALLALNLMEKRYWCKYLCPLGALLGLLSRWSPIGRSVSEGCNACGTCIPIVRGRPPLRRERDGARPNAPVRQLRRPLSP